MDNTNYNRFPLSTLVKQARKFSNFDDFSNLYSIDIYHGYYWHLTTNPAFTISTEIAPRDMSSMSAGGGGNINKGAIMLTSDLEYWEGYYNTNPYTDKREVKRPYAVLFDASDIEPRYLKQVSRGFGNEVYLFPDKAKQLKQMGVYNLKYAKELERKFHNIVPQSERELYKLWKYANSTNENKNKQHIIKESFLKNIIKEELQTINEGLSNIVYHYTYFQQLLNILKENKFHASTNIGTHADFKKTQGKFYYFSMQRTKGLTGYASHHGNNVAIVLDGNKLNQKYKGGPIDYWEWSTSSKDWTDPQHYKEALLSNELEDRIFIDKPTIDNASIYIKEIHIYINEERFGEYISKDDINNIILLTKKYNIPIYFYNNYNSFQLQNKTKTVDPNSFNLTGEKKEESERYESYFIKDVGKYIIYNNEDNKNKLFKLIDDYFKNEKPENIKNFKDDLIKQSNELNWQSKEKGYREWGASYKHDDMYNGLSAEIHNKKSNPDPIIRSILKMMTDEMRKNKIANLKDYIKFKLGFLEKANEENKSIYILWDEEGDKHLKWKARAWFWLNKEEFWNMLPETLKNNTKYVGIINNDNLTLKELYKQSITNIGKGKFVDFLKKNHITFLKIDPDSKFYDQYKNIK